MAADRTMTRQQYAAIRRGYRDARSAELISLIRFGYYGSKKLARLGHAGVARRFRATARRQIAELRALRAEVE
ncbi:MAG: hypothetical protein J0M00_13200 [Burkholderiales bacterium]|nr:hypothetical protein [Burkholderiales bacterium]